VRVTIIDYGRGNLFSLGRALDHVGVSFRLTDRPDDVRDAECLILPGVGAFGDAMDGLWRCGLVEPIRNAARRGVPLLGICLGMQLLATRGEEFGNHAGLDIVPGVVSRLPEGDGSAHSIRIPNVGWRRVTGTPGAAIGPGADGAMYYFVHSYAHRPSNAHHIMATVDVNGQAVAAIVREDAIVGCQFHPEKSGADGLALLRAFFDFAVARGAAQSPVGKRTA